MLIDKDLKYPGKTVTEDNMIKPKIGKDNKKKDKKPIKLQNLKFGRVKAKNKKPSAIKKIKNFSKETIKHLIKGSPTCTQEQIDERLVICHGCPFFERYKENEDAGVCTHTDCGCNINKELKFLNKLAWADQKCPINKWGAIET